MVFRLPEGARPAPVVRVVERSIRMQVAMIGHGSALREAVHLSCFGFCFSSAPVIPTGVFSISRIIFGPFSHMEISKPKSIFKDRLITGS